MSYTIWIEFEHYNPPALTDEDGYCNVIVNYEDGRTQGYNVWTVELFKEQWLELISEVEDRGFVTMPDLVVTRLDREHITVVLQQVIGP